MKTIYTHNELESRLTIKYQYGDIATVNLIDNELTTNIKGELVYQTAIININNLKQN